MNIGSPCSGDFPFTKHIFCNFKLVDIESESAFFFSDGHIVKLEPLHTESRAVHSK